MTLAMRSDMHEVIIERPRWGHRYRYPRRRVRNLTRARDREGGEETWPRCEAMGGVYRDKSLSDNLAPLERYLRSQVGRPWSKVWSEISAQLSATSAIKKHVMDHLRQFVVEKVREDEDGRFWGPGRYGRPEVPWRFFVHPRSGALAEMPPYPRKRQSRAPLPRPDVRVLSPTLHLRRVRGIWYAVVIAPFPMPHPENRRPVMRDAIAKIDPRDGYWHREHEDLGDLWHTQRYAQSLRQLSKREIRRYLGG